MRTISGTAAAAASVLTVTRTSCEPAWASRATWIAVASASAVSVFVIDWTTIGWALPTSTPPTSTRRRSARRGGRQGRSRSWARGAAADRIRAMSKPVIQMRNANRNTNPTTYVSRSARRLIRVAEDRLEHDHQHPAAVERRERQDVHEREVGRQDAGDVERHDRPAPRRTRRRSASRCPTGPETGGGAVGFADDRGARSPSPPRISPNQRMVSLDPDCDRGRQIAPCTAGEVGLEERLRRRRRCPARPCPRRRRPVGRSVTLDLAVGPVRVSTPSVTSSPACAAGPRGARSPLKYS